MIVVEVHQGRIWPSECASLIEVDSGLEVILVLLRRSKVVELRPIVAELDIRQPAIEHSLGHFEVPVEVQIACPSIRHGPFPHDFVARAKVSHKPEGREVVEILIDGEVHLAPDGQTVVRKEASERRGHDSRQQTIDSQRGKTQVHDVVHIRVPRNVRVVVMRQKTIP